MKTTRTAVFFAAAAALVVAALWPMPRPYQRGAPRQAIAPALQLATVTAQPTQGTGESSLRVSAKLGNKSLPATERVGAFAKINLEAAHVSGTEHRGPIDVALVLDRSGSMAGEKLLQAKQAAQALLGQLRNGDRLTLIDYGSDVQVQPPVVMTDGNRDPLTQYLNSLRESGGTNIGAGLQAGLGALEAPGEYLARRVILVSDGQPTEGLTDSPALVALAAQLREKGAAVTAIGVGTDYNDLLMREIANSGGGFYAYLRDGSQLQDIFRRELGQATLSVAQRVDILLKPARGVVVKDVPGFPTRNDADGNTVVHGYDLASDQKATLLVELSVGGGDDRAVLGVEVRYHDVLAQRQQTLVLTLTANRTDNAEALAAGRDEEVFADSLRAIGSKQLAQATVEFERGNKAEGLRLFDNVRQLFGASAEALAGDIRSLDSSAQALAGADNHAAVRNETLTLRKNLSNFGTNNAY